MNKLEIGIEVGFYYIDSEMRDRYGVGTINAISEDEATVRLGFPSKGCEDIEVQTKYLFTLSSDIRSDISSLTRISKLLWDLGVTVELGEACNVDIECLIEFSRLSIKSIQSYADKHRLVGNSSNSSDRNRGIKLGEIVEVYGSLVFVPADSVHIDTIKRIEGKLSDSE
jgi:hypothetical protein